MHYYEVAPTTIIRPDSMAFTYSSPVILEPGQIVKIEVGKKQLTGFVIKKVVKPSYKTKSITKVLDLQPVPKQLIDLSFWISKYYVSHLATVLQLLLPRGLEKTRRETTDVYNGKKQSRTNILLNKYQSSAIKKITSSKATTTLLQGVTGSGKTNVYLELAKKSIANKKSVIVLVPEIALTSQLVSEFSNHFKNVLVLHSQLGEASRHLKWTAILRSSEPVIVVGPRSALFSPLKNVGTIIVDEAHEPAYKQESSPKYSALRVATILGRLHGAKVVLGSATPSVTDRYLAETTEESVVKLPFSARKNSVKSLVSLVDMTKKDNRHGSHRFLSKQLLSKIEESIASNQQVLIFHNRRGSASTTLCDNCGWMAMCPNCTLPLTLHADKHKLMCHTCGASQPVPKSCPDCQHIDIIFKGFGTKLIESELQKLFPKANIGRFDADNKTKDTVNSRYEELRDGTIDIAIGTQVIAKGLDLPNLRLVGVIQADSGLSLPDFSSNERTFQLLAQVVGRVGRDKHKTEVVVQSYRTTHPSVMFGINQDYDSFYKFALKERENALFPPFTHLLKLSCSYKTEQGAIKAAKALSANLKQKIHKDISILGPTPALYEKQNGNYKWQIILKSPKRSYLLEALEHLPTSHWQYELDPSSLL